MDVASTTLNIPRKQETNMKTNKTVKATESARSQYSSCPRCGKNRVSTSIEEQEYVYGTGDSAVRLNVEIPIHECKHCEILFTDWVAEDIKHNALCQHLGVLNPTKITQLREKYEMTRTAFAELTGIGEASLNRWEKGINIQNIAYDRYLRLLEDPVILNQLKRTVLRIESHKQGLSDNFSLLKSLKNPTKLKEEQKVFELRLAA